MEKIYQQLWKNYVKHVKEVEKFCVSPNISRFVISEDLQGKLTVISNKYEIKLFFYLTQAGNSKAMVYSSICWSMLNGELFTAKSSL